MKYASHILTVVSLLFFISCSKEKSYEGKPFVPGELNDQWEFREAGVLFKGNFTDVFKQTQGDMEAITLQGTSDPAGGLIFIQIIGEPILPGEYTGDQGVFQYVVNGEVKYGSSSSGNNFSIKILSVENGKIKGEFSGKVTDQDGNEFTITDGKFSGNTEDEDSDGTSEGNINCLSININGIYQADQELNSDNFINIGLEVTKEGTYSIISNNINGMVFFSEGEFETTGLQYITLNGIGKPVEDGEFEFELSFDGKTCSFNVTVSGEESLVEGSIGTLAAQNRTPVPQFRDTYKYWLNNQKIGEIISSVSPRRIINYNGQDKISIVNYYQSVSGGGWALGARTKFNYNSSGNVESIVFLDQNGASTDTFFRYVWNSDGTIKEKYAFDQNGNNTDKIIYNYSNGNITGIEKTSSSGTTTYTIDYDTRENNFPDIHDQFYFIDPAAISDADHIFEIFYFSSNYPVKITTTSGQADIEVTINPSRRPLRIDWNGSELYRYEYN